MPQLFNSKTKGILAEDSEVHECEVYAEGARVVCLTRKTREVEEMDPEGQPTGNKVPTPMGTWRGWRRRSLVVVSKLVSPF